MAELRNNFEVPENMEKLNQCHTGHQLLVLKTEALQLAEHEAITLDQKEELTAIIKIGRKERNEMWDFNEFCRSVNAEIDVLTDLLMEFKATIDFHTTFFEGE